MARGKARPPANPVTYAEEVLNVHDVLAQAVDEHQALDKALKDRTNHANAIRSVREELNDHEAELTSNERAANSEMSATAFREHMKVAFQQDDDAKKLREMLREHQDGYEEADAEVKRRELRIRINTARMEELGGLLRFYAAAREAKKHPKPDKPRSREAEEDGEAQ